MGSLAAVVPARNEAEAIGEVVRGLRGRGACCVLVVDGASSDDTPRRAAAAGAIVVRESRPGYGRACLTGAASAQAHHRHELIAFLDGDGSCDPSDLPRLVAHAVSADMVLGARGSLEVERGAYPLHARVGNLLAATLIAARTGTRVRDLSPFKVVRADVLARLQLRQEGYAWTTELVARACADASVRLVEVPIGFRARRGSESKVSGRLLPSVRAGIQMLRAAMTETAPRPRLVLMAKSPARAKSRLAAEAGAGVASGFWTASLTDTAANLLKAAQIEDLEVRLMLSAADEVEHMNGLLGPAWVADVQPRAGLDEALVSVFDAAQVAGSPFAIAVSGDNPTLPSSVVQDAVRALRRFDAVLGPTPDGGYYLVGFRRSSLARRNRTALLHTVFDRHVSGAAARDATQRAITRAGLSVAMLEPWADVDNLADLRRLAVDVSAAPQSAPATNAWLTGRARWLLRGHARSPELHLISSEGGESNARG